ncbi:MAG: NUDIX hydrolase [Methylobacteriaceae bacterium]|nr:NUDIX hydrolase [Methylobacteriaceae bacterium]
MALDKAALLDELTRNAPRSTSGPKLTPRDAATLIVIDRSGREPAVLFGRRHPGLKFMPGQFVFPGGRIEPGDRSMTAGDDLDPRVEARLLRRMRRPTASRARALALAAIRETFEETGLVIGARAGAGPAKPPPSGAWSAFAAHGVAPALARLHFVARAITPPGRPKRFDTRFFAVDADAVAHRVEGVVGPDAELVELVWKPLSQVQTLDLPAITRVILRELDERIAAGFSADLAAPFYHERFGRRLREEL